MQCNRNVVEGWITLGKKFSSLYPEEFAELRGMFISGKNTKEQNFTIRRRIKSIDSEIHTQMTARSPAIVWFFRACHKVCPVCKGNIYSYIKKGQRNISDWCSITCRNKDPANKLFGEDNHAATDAVKQKIAARFAEYEGGHPQRDPAVRAKTVATCMERFGGPNPASDPMRAAKRQKTSMERYGVPDPMHDPEVYERAQKNRFRHDTIRLKGATHKVQGYEANVFKSIEAKLKWIRTRPSEQPHIIYTLDGVPRRYYPDATAVTRAGSRCVIEVKSTWSLGSEPRRNRKKFAAARDWCAAQGATFMLALSDGKNVTWFKDPSDAECVQLIRECRSAHRSKVRWKER